MLMAKNIHGEKFDYSNVVSDNIMGRDSKISIICNTCEYNWAPSIDQHINGKTGCPMCAGHLNLTLPNFIFDGTEIHEGKHDYSQISPDHIINNRSKVPIKCKICEYEWSPAINNYINGRTGCPKTKTS